MDFNTTIDLIIRELDEARDLIEDLKKIPDAPLLQIELAESKCRNAATVISLLKNLHESGKQKDTQTAERKKGPVKTDQSSATYYGPEKKDEDEDEKDQPVPVTGHEITEPDDHETKAGQESAEPPDKDDEIETDRPGKKPFVAPIIADTFSHLANRYNEKLGDTDDYPHGGHVTNLSEAIGVNDRFYYIREIFNGDRETYNHALSKLEKTTSLEEARDILMSYSTGKTGTAAFKQLLDLVKRKIAR